MQRSAPSILTAVLTIASAVVSAPGQDRLSNLVTQAERLGVRTGVEVRALRSGDRIYAHRADEMFLPASNQKILTVAAVLWGLGSDHRIRTVFQRVDNVLEVRAAADPNWITGSAHDPKSIFVAVARALRRQGVERLAGIRLLDGPFTGPARPAAWPQNQFDRYYCAPSGGLVLDASMFEARISPGVRRAGIELLAPPADLRIGGQIKITRAKKKRYSYWLSQGDGSLRGHGEFPAHGRAITVRGVVQEPAWMFEQCLRTVLRGEGIAVAEGGDDRDQPILARPKPAVTHVYTHVSRVQDAFAPILKDSSNFHAEQLFRILGAEKAGRGTFARGRLAVRAMLEAHSEPPEGLQIDDGSGLSRGNRVSPAYLIAVMRKLCADRDGKLFVASLSQGGVDGTLKGRFRKARDLARDVWAKTGTINGVKALSGIVRSAAGEMLAFSILMNRREGTSTSGLSALQDRMVAAIHQGRAR